MNYNLNSESQKVTTIQAIRKMLPFLRDEKKSLIFALIAMLINSTATFLGPFIIGRAIDKYIIPKDWHGVILSALVLVAVFLVAFIANYFQVMQMGMVGQRTLYSLRNILFSKIQSLPVSFFNQNKAGDLISRINNDTDKLNQFFSEILVRFVGILVSIIGIGAFLIGINPRLGVITLLPAVGILIVTQFISPWIKKRTETSLRTTGSLSAEIQESLDNFKVIIAFNRRDFFRERFAESNNLNYNAARSAGIANATPGPLYDFAGNTAQLLVLVVGISMMISGHFSLGLLVSFFVYVERFYSPLRQLSMLWIGLQTALAAWDRISVILGSSSDLEIIKNTLSGSKLLSFNNVSFGYPEGIRVLEKISLDLEIGKTYALVGPTGGGKTTTASLMARLYDPIEGSISLLGKDIRSYSDKERTGIIGFILQDPFLFSGTIRENIFYANPYYEITTDDEAFAVLKETGLDSLLNRFDEGLSTMITPSAGTMSLGQRQMIAFMRAVLRRPKLLILDEATANIDTISEQVLGEILDRLPTETTRVIIAHRLNTIQNADQIFFVGGGNVTNAGSFEHAVEMLMHEKDVH